VWNNPINYTDPSGMCVAGKDDGCFVDSFSGIDHLINSPMLSNNSDLWWQLENYKRQYCENKKTDDAKSKCLDEQSQKQKILEAGNDEIRNSACIYVDCFEGEAKFVGKQKIQFTTSDNSANYAITPVGLIECNCFTAGTTVLTEDGEKAIEDIKIGDKVLAKSDKTGEMFYQEVEWLFRKEINETYNITVNNQVITTTDEHPFWIIGKGWVEARKLKIGDKLVTSDNSELIINKIEVKKENVIVYNFKVKDFHTYFVSNLHIWTHNKDSCGSLISGQANYQVYYGYTNGKLVYVGITNDFNRRKKEHGDRFDRIEPAYNGQYFNKWQARGIEQYNIEQYGMQKNGGQLENKNNSISIYRSQYNTAKKWTSDFIQRNRRR
jgi:hypothetical protein